ncbi:MAG TPA: NUDIX hydrolase [Beutenbergiaceae bacterium]|nr:NUDIX hydrolase [Beutenbergiaceae bacterium]
MNKDSPRVCDEPVALPVVESTRAYQGMVWNVRSEVVDLGESGQVRREFIDHTGAVAILALDEHDHVLLLRQYRHPVRSHLWELPAGLLDEPEESWVEAAKRELYEEADLRAQRWFTLADFYTSPGASDETMRVFLARDLSRVAEQDRYVREAEEADMIATWVPLDEAVNLVLTGSLHNPATVVGVMAAHLSRQHQWTTLRPVDAAFDSSPGG